MPSIGSASGSSGARSRQRKATRAVSSSGVICSSRFSGIREAGLTLTASDVLPGDDLALAALELQDEALVAVLLEQAREDSTVGGRDERRLIRGADDEAGVEEIREQLLVGTPAVARDVGSDLLPLAVDLVALGADLLEDGTAGDRVGVLLSDGAVADPVDDLLSGRIAALADGSPRSIGRGRPVPGRGSRGASGPG